jgi:putative DNA primase/helicase
MIDGPTPNHHFEASTEGTGKGLLAAACAFPAIGRELDINAQKESEAEWRKALTSAFISGSSHFLLDNMYNPLGWDDVPQEVNSGTLAAAWTLRYWKDRLLGGNKEVRIRIQTVFMSTGNNVFFSKELDRRLNRIELLTPCENPSLRTGFKHDPLIDWARTNRRKLLEACLTLCQRWIADGMPKGTEVAGSYENYVRVMGGILGSIGVDGFLKNRAKKVATNPETARWSALVEVWRATHGVGNVSAADLIAMIGKDVPLAEHFFEVLGEGTDLSRKQRLGKALVRVEGRVYHEWRIVRSETKTSTGNCCFRLQDPKIKEQKEDGENHPDHDDVDDGTPY